MQIARKNREIQILKDTFGIVTIIVFTLSWTLSLLFSISIVKRISEPMTRLSKHLEKLKPENMMPIADSPSMDHELSVVVGSLNNMILRLKDNMKRERQITENISHEFKTPLTRIASNLQVGRVKEAEVEVLELGGNVDALLSLAIWDNAKENTDLIPIIKHLKKLIPDELSVNIILAKKILTSLPSAHLQIIFRNLIDNAIKHNKANGEIKIVGRILEKKWVVEIDNTTKNVVDKNRVTLRKYKTGKGAGQGIGMAIVADMCRMHGLTLDYIDEVGRAKVIVSGVIVG
jgi:signal transduction histidine kinase